MSNIIIYTFINHNFALLRAAHCVQLAKNKESEKWPIPVVCACAATHTVGHCVLARNTIFSAERHAGAPRSLFGQHDKRLLLKCLIWLFAAQGIIAFVPNRPSEKVNQFLLGCCADTAVHVWGHFLFLLAQAYTRARVNAIFCHCHRTGSEIRDCADCRQRIGVRLVAIDRIGLVARSTSNRLSDNQTQEISNDRYSLFRLREFRKLFVDGNRLIRPNRM